MRRARRGAGLLAIALAASACSQPGTVPSVPVATATRLPGASSDPVAPSIESAVVPTTASPSASEPAIPEPPGASIAVDGGDPVVGELGSFTWQNTGSDTPWLPGNPIHVGAGEQLTLILADPVAITTWAVNRAPAGANGVGLTGVADGSGEPVTFPAPPSGSWSVSVDVSFAGSLGSAAYYWLIDVD